MVLASVLLLCLSDTVRDARPELADETEVFCETELAVDGAVGLKDVLAWLRLVRPARVDVLQDPNHGAAVLYRVSGGAVVVEAVGVGGYWHGAVWVAAAWSGAAVTVAKNGPCPEHDSHARASCLPDSNPYGRDGLAHSRSLSTARHARRAA